jgi:hypothetical protein
MDRKLGEGVDLIRLSRCIVIHLQSVRLTLTPRSPVMRKSLISPLNFAR